MNSSKPRYCLRCKRKLSKRLVKKGRRLCDNCLEINNKMGFILRGNVLKYTLEDNWFEESLLWIKI